MILTTPSVKSLLGRLSETLDEEIRMLDLRRAQLGSLSRTIVQRDEQRMGTILEEIEQALGVQAGLDGKLKDTRTALANALVCRPEEITLQGLIEKLDGPERQELADRRRRIVEEIEKLRQQHMETCILLLECARINRLMLEAMFPASKGLTTYDSDGPDRWLPETGLVDAER